MTTKIREAVLILEDAIKHLDKATSIHSDPSASMKTARLKPLEVIEESSLSLKKLKECMRLLEEVDKEINPCNTCKNSCESI